MVVESSGASWWRGWHGRGGGILLTFLLAAGCVEIRVPDPGVHYVAFGDSTTAGPAEADYVDTLAGLLGEETAAFANEGHGGEDTEEGLARLRTLLSSQIYPDAEVLLYWEGGGDIVQFIRDEDPLLWYSPSDPDYPLGDDLARRLDETQGNIESAIAAGQNAGLKVYVATYYFIREDFDLCEALLLDVIIPVQAQRANVYLTRLNERIRTAAAARGAVLVDVAAEDDVIRADPGNYFNCNHLSEQGNAIVADLFFEAVVMSGG